MNSFEFETRRQRLNDLCEVVLTTKGRDYAGEGEDRLANFRLIPQILATFNVDAQTPIGTWAVYFLKHVFAIMAYAGQASESEPIEGRFVDARNYIDLGYALMKEKSE